MLAILVPFIISTILAAVFVPMGDTSYQNIIMYTPENYTNMTIAERAQWLNESHGGTPVFQVRIGPSWEFPFFLQYWYVFPDGFEMSSGEMERWLNGDAGDPDYLQVALAILGLNPPQLESLGIFGVLIRIILVVSVAIGLVELIWFG